MNSLCESLTLMVLAVRTDAFFIAAVELCEGLLSVG